MRHLVHSSTIGKLLEPCEQGKRLCLVRSSRINDLALGKAVKLLRPDSCGASSFVGRAGATWFLKIGALAWIHCGGRGSGGLWHSGGVLELLQGPARQVQRKFLRK